MESNHRTFASITTWEWLVLLLILPAALFPAGPQVLLLLAIPFFWFLHLINGERLFPPTPFNVSLAVMALMLVISLFIAFDFSLGLAKVTGVLYGIGLLMSSSRLIRDQSGGVWWVVAVLLLNGIVIAVAGLVGVRWLDPFGPLNALKTALPASLQVVPGAVGGVINENELAGTLAWILPLFVACLIGLPRNMKRYGRLAFAGLALASLLITGVIIATQSRAGVLAVLSSIALVMALFVPRQWRLVVGVLAVVTSLVWYLSYGNALQVAAPGVEAIGLSSRLEIWARALNAIGDFPITGISLNGFRRVLPALYPTFLVPTNLDLGHAHNHLLQTALDLGLPGLVGYVSIWFIAAGALIRSRSRLIHLGEEQHPYYALTIGLAGSLVAGWVFGLLDAIALGARPGFIWWLLIALSGGVHYLVMYQMDVAGRRRRRKSRDLPPPIVQPEPSPPIEEPSYPESRPVSRPRMRYRPPPET